MGVSQVAVKGKLTLSKLSAQGRSLVEGCRGVEKMKFKNQQLGKRCLRCGLFLSKECQREINRCSSRIVAYRYLTLVEIGVHTSWQRGYQNAENSETKEKKAR